MNDSAGAENLLQKAISIDKNCAAAHHLYAQIMGGRGEAEASLLLLKKAARLAPDDPVVLCELAVALKVPSPIHYHGTIVALLVDASPVDGFELTSPVDGFELTFDAQERGKREEGLAILDKARVIVDAAPGHPGKWELEQLMSTECAKY